MAFRDPEMFGHLQNVDRGVSIKSHATPATWRATPATPATWRAYDPSALGSALKDAYDTAEEGAGTEKADEADEERISPGPS